MKKGLEGRAQITYHLGSIYNRARRDHPERAFSLGIANGLA
jgi:hypothetical protein